MRILTLLLLFISLYQGKVYSQNSDSIKKATYTAYTKGQLSLWEEASSISKANYQKNKSNLALHELIMTQYGHLAYCISDKEQKKGRLVLSEALSNLEKLSSSTGETTEVIALRATFLAFELNLYPLKMMKIGPKAVKLTDKAYEMDRNNLMALLCKANQLNFTPSMFGGSTEKAIPLYLEIIELFDNKTVSSENDWRYISTMVTLASTYEKDKKYDMACRLYEKIIAVDPTISWINNKLYPECLSKVEAGNN